MWWPEQGGFLDLVRHFIVFEDAAGGALTVQTTNYRPRTPPFSDSLPAGATQFNPSPLGAATCWRCSGVGAPCVNLSPISPKRAVPGTTPLIVSGARCMVCTMDSVHLKRLLFATVVPLFLTSGCASNGGLEGKYSNSAGQYVEFKDHNKANLNVNGIVVEVDYAENGKEVILGPSGGGLVATITDAGCLKLAMASAPLCK